jgi:hypothetical protein
MSSTPYQRLCDYVITSKKEHGSDLISVTISTKFSGDILQVDKREVRNSSIDGIPIYVSNFQKLEFMKGLSRH